MLRGMSRLVTGGDLIAAALAVMLGAGIGVTVTALMDAGGARVLVSCIIGVATFGVLLARWLGVFRRYRKLRDGRCPNPMCNGVVQRSQHAGAGKVVCPTCKKIWPELARMQFRVTSRT